MNTFKLRFENKPFFDKSMTDAFKDANDLIEYFQSFFKEYTRIGKIMEPISKSRMQGNEVANYNTLHSEYQRLKEHYSLLLTVGSNGFDIWLNSYLK